MRSLQSPQIHSCYRSSMGSDQGKKDEVKDMPVTVAVDPTGHSTDETGLTEWRAKIAKIPVLAH